MIVYDNIHTPSAQNRPILCTPDIWLDSRMGYAIDVILSRPRAGDDNGSFNRNGFLFSTRVLN